VQDWRARVALVVAALVLALAALVLAPGWMSAVPVAG